MPNEENTKDKIIKRKMLQRAATEKIVCFGSVAKAHLVSLILKDNETGKVAKRSLESVSKSNINLEYRETNIKQQAGFSAKIKATARKNADAIIVKFKSFIAGCLTKSSIFFTAN